MSDVKIDYTREILRSLAVIRERIADNFKNRLACKILSCYRCYNLGIQNYTLSRTSITSHYKSKNHRTEVNGKNVQVCLCNKHFFTKSPLYKLYFLRHIFFCILQSRLPPGIHNRFGAVTTLIIQNNSSEAYFARQAFLRETACAPVSLPPVETEFQLQPQQRTFLGDTSPNMHFIDSQSIDKVAVPLPSTTEEVSMDSTSTTDTSCDTSTANTQDDDIMSLNYTEDISENDYNLLLHDTNRSNLTFRNSRLYETLQKVLNKKKVSNLDRIKLDVLNEKYQADLKRDVKHEKQRVHKRFLRFFLDFARKHKCERFTCSLCKPNVQMQVSRFMEHNFSHLKSHMNQDIRCCCVCGTYFFLHNTLNLYNPNYFEHVCSCVTGKSLLQDALFFPRFIHICSSLNCYFDPNDELASIYQSEDINFVPKLDNWLLVLRKIQSTIQPTWYVEQQMENVYACNFIKSSILQVDDLWSNLEKNDDVETHVINERRCFSCGPEIRKAADKAANDAVQYERLIKRFGNNSFFLSRPKPRWLTHCSFVQPNVFQEELLDSTKCGLTLWIVRLANILEKSLRLNAGDENRPYFVHMFLYATNYALILQHIRANDVYVLPHTCLCSSKSDMLDPLNTHRHLIAVYRNRSTMNRLNKELQNIRVREVHIDGLNPVPVNNIDTEATQRVQDYQLAGVKLKIKYVVNITSPLHFLNTVNYVSREKMDTLFHLNYKIQKNDNDVLTLADIKNEISNMNNKTINFHYSVNPVSTCLDACFELLAAH